MARQVIWSIRAQADRRKILEYWRLRNKSDSYSRKLSRLFKESVKIIRHFPHVGKQTDQANARIKIVKDYLIIYEVSDTQIIILTIWDSRQNPEALLKSLQ